MYNAIDTDIFVRIFNPIEGDHRKDDIFETFP